MSLRHISGWVDVTDPNGPVDPGYGTRPPWSPVDPGWGNRPPTDPGYGRPDVGGGRPDNSLPGGGYVWGSLAKLVAWALGPHIDTKPPGRPVLPPSVDNGLPPNGGAPPHPWLPGSWEPIDPGFGKPPQWGWILRPDNGLPIPPARPDAGLPGGGGSWVPTDPDWGVGCPPCGGKPHPPIWAWIPGIDNSLPGGGTGGGSVTVTLFPTSVTALAAGGSGSVNPTITPAGGTWQIDAASVPAWVSISPMGPQTADVSILWTVTTNTTGLPRQAMIKVSGATLTINQGAA